MPTADYRNSKGEKLSGTTTIIGSNLGWSKQQLMYWAWNQGKLGKDFRETKERAGDVGTLAHYLIECDIKGIPPDISAIADKEILGLAEIAYLNFLEWKGMANFKVHTTEPHLVSEVYQFGGTPDCIAEIKGKLALFDWKSGGIYEDVLLQLVAYKALWEENHPNEPLNGGFHLLQINKENASFTHRFWHALPDSIWQAFLSLLQLHNIHKQFKGLIK